MKMTCRTFLTVFPLKVVKGKFANMDRVIYASWTSGMFQTCSSVGVKTSQGSEVLFFMPNGSTRPIMEVGHDGLLIGTPDMKSTKAEQGADGRSATALDSKAQ